MTFMVRSPCRHGGAKRCELPGEETKRKAETTTTKDRKRQKLEHCLFAEDWGMGVVINGPALEDIP